MKVLALGCSFTKGAELVDPDASAWPSVLAGLTGWSIDNHAENGGSNDMMFRKAIEMSDDYDLVIVAWTEANRLEVWVNEPVIFNGRIYDVGPTSINSLHSEKVFPWSKEYFSRWLVQVIALQSYFDSVNKKFIFLSAFGNTERVQSAKTSLVNKLNLSNWVDYPRTITQWTSKLPRGRESHPLEQGHQLVAEKIHEHIRNRGWLP
jgi:hypothetical protein